MIEAGDAEPRTLRRAADGPFTVVEDSANGVTHWRTVDAHGALTPELLADRPVEERLRPHWSLTWAVPVDATDSTPARPRTAPVVHAPTPSDEALGVPALLIASFPLDTTRRHAAPGPLTDFLVQRAADAYAELLADWRPVSDGIIGLVPGPLGKGELDGALRQAVLERLPRTSFLPPAVEPREQDSSCPSPCGPGTPRWSKARAPTPCRSSPRSCPPSSPPGSNGAWSCGRWASPGSR